MLRVAAMKERFFTFVAGRTLANRSMFRSVRGKIEKFISLVAEYWDEQRERLDGRLGALERHEIVLYQFNVRGRQEDRSDEKEHDAHVHSPVLQSLVYLVTR